VDARAAAIDRLAVAADRSPDEFEFYLPQMCSFLLLGVFVQSPQLCRLLLDKCSACVWSNSPLMDPPVSDLHACARVCVQIACVCAQDAVVPAVVLPVEPIVPHG
jgi:hypothetical protein